MFMEIDVNLWDEAKRLGDMLRGFTFRGQSNREWPLNTSIERVSRKFNCPTGLIPTLEYSITYRFRQRVHQFLAKFPHEDSIIEWFALMQHYGAPTRLLDFTESFYVAAFFAMELSDCDSSIWCINEFRARRIRELAGVYEKDIHENQVNEMIVDFAHGFIRNPDHGQNLAFQVRPILLQDRMSNQQGVFFFQANLKTSFMDNLFGSIGADHEVVSVPCNKVSQRELWDANLIKINIPRKCHRTALEDLMAMNITSATLFPGLDGFARSLVQHFRALDVRDQQEELTKELRATFPTECTTCLWDKPNVSV